MLGEAAFLPADVEVVANQVKERLLADERGGPIEGLSVAAGGRLLDEDQQPGEIAGCLPIGVLAAAADYEADFFNPGGGDDFLQDDLQGRLLRPVNVDETLEGQTILAATSGGNYGFSDVHDRVPGPLRARARRERRLYPQFTAIFPSYNEAQAL